MQVLVAAASKHGATAEIAKRIGERLETAGLEVEVCDIAKVAAAGDHDTFVIGSGVYAGQWLKSARTLVERNSVALAQSQVWLFSSGPLGDPLKPDGESAVDISSISDAIHPNEHKLLAGAIDKYKLGFGERAIVKALRAPMATIATGTPSNNGPTRSHPDYSIPST